MPRTGSDGLFYFALGQHLNANESRRDAGEVRGE